MRPFLPAAALCALASMLTASRANATPPIDLPWRCGSTHAITQGHHNGSHRGKGAWAWDADLKVGDPIFAVASGVIRGAKQDSDRYGCDEAFSEDGNHIILDFEDGTEALYLHLLRDSLEVEPGDRVVRGQFLGRVGKSGKICGAKDEGVHLHFQIQRTCEGWYCPSIPARFDMQGDPFFGQSLTSRNCEALPRCEVAPDRARSVSEESRCFEDASDWWWTAPAGGHGDTSWRYTYTSDASEPIASATWRFETQLAGDYVLEAFIPSGATSARATYTLTCSKEERAQVTLSQRALAGAWGILGEWRLPARARCEVSLDDATGEPYVEEDPVILGADALRVTPVRVEGARPLDDAASPWLTPNSPAELSGAGGHAEPNRCAITRVARPARDAPLAPLVAILCLGAMRRRRRHQDHASRSLTR